MLSNNYDTGSLTCFERYTVTKKRHVPVVIHVRHLHK